MTHSDSSDRRRACGVAMPYRSRKSVGLFPVRIKVSASVAKVENPAMIPSGSAVDPGDFLELDETDPKLLDEHFLIKGSQLLKLFRFCPSCGSKIANSARHVSLMAIGTAPIVHYICTACSPFEKRFEGQEEEAPHSSEMSFTSSMDTTMASVVTETMYEESQWLAEEAPTDVQSTRPGFALNQLKTEEDNGCPSEKRFVS
ncbi:hypothetical protein TELCIR_14630 [Teladorsagia circumcincta]|uniref:Uncharacterized protein n=1 Tax=Teladorsagia circumcincta TaxID=45464 RepID=A0A2G9U0N3_TELCI|nr:hypothetical protein TELCIR_14630 [Teladorsagia circumcincta]